MATFNQSSSRRTPQHHNTANQTLTIYVGNLSFNTIEDDLKTFFHDQCGDVQKVRIIYDNNTYQSRGFGFVYFNTIDAYNSALKLHGYQLDGRELRIAPAEDKNSLSSAVATTNTPVDAVTTATPPTTTNRPRTQVVHCKKSNYDVYIGRPSDWGNPFVIGKDGDRADVIRKYRNWIMRQPDLLSRAKKELRGQRIACWCKPEACHGDVLAEIADAD
jgi:RNA recognition motif-containing protein